MLVTLNPVIVAECGGRRFAKRNDIGSTLNFSARSSSPTSTAHLVHRSVATHASTGRFVRPNPSSCSGKHQFRRSSMEDPVVVCCHVPERGECPSIYQSISLNSTYLPSSSACRFISIREGYDLYLPSKPFYRKLYEQVFQTFCENRSAHFVGKRVRLTTETPSDEGPCTLI